ncbi:MAG: mechanosensitive ion channel [bacterium]
MRYAVKLWVVWLVAFACMTQAWAQQPLESLQEITKPSAQTKDDTSVAPVGIAVDRFDDGWKQSRKDLAAAYSALLVRDNFSLDTDVDDTLAEWIASEASKSAQLSMTGALERYVLPAVVVLLLLVLIGLVDRRATRTAHRYQSRVDFHTLEWINALYRSFVIVVARSMPPLMAVILSFFPVQAVFGRAPWTQAVSAGLLIFVAWRAVSAFGNAAIAFRLVTLKDQSARRLLGVFSWGARIGLTWTAIYTIASALLAPDPVLNWIRFLTIASMTLVTAFLLGVRDEVIELVAPVNDSSGRLARVVRRYYYPTVGVTFVVMALGAFGYWSATFFILSRVYGLLILFFATLRLSQLLRNFIARRVEAAESRDEADLFRSIGGMARIAAALAFLGVTTRLFLLDDALAALLGTPILGLGRVQIAPLHIFDGLVVLFVALLLSRVVRAVLLSTIYPRLGIDVGVGYAINTLLNYAFIVIGFIIGLTVLGVDLTSLTVVVASLGVGIGLGLQTLTENLVSGFILLFGRSVKKGDVITVNGLYGRVEDVGARSVVIRTPDNYDMLVPSKSLVNGDVINWSYRDPYIRLHIPVGVTYQCNPREVERILTRAALAHPKVQRDPPPEVWLREFGDSSVNFELLVFFDLREITQARLRGQINFLIWDMLHDAGIEIPFPQRDLHIRSGEAFPEIARALEKIAERLPASSVDVHPSEQTPQRTSESD